MKKILLLAAALSSSLSMAQSTIRIEHRCEEDSIGVTEGRGRNNWAKKCAHISHRVWDFNMYDDAGKLRGRPYYPSFANPGNFDDWWRAPWDVKQPCFESLVSKYSNIITCLASCYTPDQKVLFSDGDLAIGAAFQQKKNGIVTLADDAGLDDLRFTVRDLYSYSESRRDVDHVILQIETESGGRLKVTENHPLLVSTGHMREAADLRTGDALIRQDGVFDEVIAITRIPYFGKVYNVKPVASSRRGQVVVAQGYLNGSIWYQNTGAMHINRLIMRDSLPEDLLN